MSTNIGKFILKMRRVASLKFSTRALWMVQPTTLRLQRKVALKSNNRSTKLFSEIIGIIYDFKNRKLIY